MSTPLACIPSIPEALVEIFTTIHQFTTSADFAIWLTDGQFNHQVYENVIEEKKHNRTYQYDYEGHIFFQGKIEVDLSLFPAKTVKAFTDKSLLSATNPVFNEVGKSCISKVFAEPYYTIISHGLYKEKISGMIWEIYNIDCISNIYKRKRKPS